MVAGAGALGAAGVAGAEGVAGVAGAAAVTPDEALAAEPLEASLPPPPLRQPLRLASVIIVKISAQRLPRDNTKDAI